MLQHFRVFLLLLLAFGLPAEARSQDPETTSKNLLLISIDTLRADHLGAYGYFRETSPTIDALASESLLFENCLTPLATTLPAHTSIFTGTHPLEHGLLANVGATGKRFASGPGMRSFAEIAGERGYRTAGFVSAAPLTRETGFPAGFDEYDEPQEDERRAGVTTRRVLDWLDDPPDGPFFLFVHYFDPHFPYKPPAPYKSMFTTNGELERFMDVRGIGETIRRPLGKVQTNSDAHNRYDGEIRYVDDELAKLFERLRERELWETTAVILLSDHGEGLGDHEMVGHGYIHREQLHVPLIMRIPGVAPRRVSRVVSLADVLPTYLGAVGRAGWEPFLEQASGRDVLARGGNRDAVLSTKTARERDDLTGPVFALSLDRWKLVHEPETGDRLFDLGSDPFELTNRLSSQRRRAGKLLEQLNETREAYEAHARELGRDPGQADEEPIDAELLKKLEALGYVE